jgi:hypothetical protein
MLSRDLVNAMNRNDPKSNEYKGFKEEFYVLCMINCLFGNPSINLITIMDGTNNLIQNQTRFTEKKFTEEDLQNPIVLDRKRRNAVTEFLKYYCKTEFPVLG